MYESHWSPDDMCWIVRTTRYREILARCSTLDECIEAITNARYTPESYEFARLCLRGACRGMVERAIHRLRKARRKNRRKPK